MGFFSRIFIQGLLTILPIALTLWVLWGLGAMAEALLGPPLQHGLPDGVYRPGMGVAAGVVLIFLVGLLVHAWVIRQFIACGEHMLNHVPLIKVLYGPMRDLMRFFSSTQKEMGQVVMVRMGQGDLRLIGFVTRQEFGGVPKGIGDENKVAVYLPMSYQLGGYMVVVPKEAIEPIDMSVEDAMKFALTAGITTRDETNVARTAK